MVESGKELGILVNTQQLGLLVQLHIFCCRYAAFSVYTSTLNILQLRNA